MQSVLSGGETVPSVLRIGLIGLGYWGPNYVRVIGEIPGAELTWVCDRRPAQLEIVSASGAHATSDHDQVLSAGDVDAVVIATPTSTHAELAAAALAADKHVLCEKPLATTIADCDLLIGAAERGGRTL